MFDIGWDEMLFTVVVAIVVIGPKDLPRALRTAGRWIGKIRRVSGHFRAGIETMIREAELEEMEKQWREQNAKIMSAHPNPDPAAPASALPAPASAEAALIGTDPGTHTGTPAAAPHGGPQAGPEAGPAAGPAAAPTAPKAS